ncbi:DUF5592 family protein [Listeria goaensis]|uniref:DUF5592 family protein n=1 Tax=Listeria goaensis TaxID=1649188 RepID=UPI000B595111|nr:DUF5592 family protein [Listeria goaensis]
MNESFDIQKSISTKTKWKGMIDFSDLLLIFFYFMILSRMRYVFPEGWSIFVIIVNVGIMVFWIWRSKSNDKLKQAQTMFRVIFKRGVTYHAIDVEGNAVGERRLP